MKVRVGFGFSTRNEEIANMVAQEKVALIRNEDGHTYRDLNKNRQLDIESPVVMVRLWKELRRQIMPFYV